MGSGFHCLRSFIFFLFRTRSVLTLCASPNTSTLQTLVLPPQVQSEVDVQSILVRARPFHDAEELLPVCYRCSTTNPLLNTQVCMFVSACVLSLLHHQPTAQYTGVCVCKCLCAIAAPPPTHCSIHRCVCVSACMLSLLHRQPTA